MHHAKGIRSVYSYNTFGSRPLFRYLLMKHREEFTRTLGLQKLTPDDVLFGQRILTNDEQAAIFGLVCQLRSKDQLISFHSALLHDIHDSGLPGLLARCCGTFRELNALHEKYLFKLDSEGVLAKLAFTDETVSYFFEKLAFAPLAIQEYAIASTWVALTSLSPEVRSLVRAFEFPGSHDVHGFSRDQILELENTFAAQLKFSTGRLALTMDIKTLDLHIPTVDPALKSILERKLRILLGETLAEDVEELRHQVLTAVLELRTSAQPVTLETIAGYLGVRQETLAYTLRNHGISIQKIKQITE
ncbi:MAG: hypothetical protein RLZZ488_1034 [Pseudomonadota bacterium]|jgi:hypothetical protein